MSKINYTINDEIVAIEDHPQGVFKMGDVFVCKALKQSPCKCGHTIVDCGVSSKKIYAGCIKCKQTWYSEGNYWFRADRFVKLDTLHDISELTEIIEKKNITKIPCLIEQK